MELQIRPTSTADLASVQAIAEEVQRTVVARRGNAGGSCPEFAASLAFYERSMCDPDTCFLVAVLSGQVAGYVLASIERTPDDLTTAPRLCIAELAVRTESRRRGIATALLAHTEAWAEKGVLTLVQLGVWEFNEEALALYRRLGYQTIMRKMEKVLAACDQEALHG